MDSMKPPVPVTIIAAETSPTDPPINVNVVEKEEERPRIVQKADGSHTLEPRTTEQQDITTAGQRKINLIWENTQSWIAIMVCAITMIAALVVTVAAVVYDKQNLQIPTILSVAFGTVIGFYFARTNHQAIGGTGFKANNEQRYEGR